VEDSFRFESPIQSAGGHSTQVHKVDVEGARGSSCRGSLVAKATIGGVNVDSLVADAGVLCGMVSIEVY
jgi:hypothetical protein